jgi:hypothetical protein
MRSVLVGLVLAAAVLAGCSTYLMDPLFVNPEEMLGDFSNVEIDLPTITMSDFSGGASFDLSTGFASQQVDLSEEPGYADYVELASQVATITSADLVVIATNDTPNVVPVSFYVSQRTDLTPANVSTLATPITDVSIPANASRATVRKALTQSGLDGIQDILDSAGEGVPFVFYMMAADGSPLDEPVTIHDVTVDTTVEADLVVTE